MNHSPPQKGGLRRRRAFDLNDSNQEKCPFSWRRFVLRITLKTVEVGLSVAVHSFFFFVEKLNFWPSTGAEGYIEFFEVKKKKTTSAKKLLCVLLFYSGDYIISWKYIFLISLHTVQGRKRKNCMTESVIKCEYFFNGLMK